MKNRHKMFIIYLISIRSVYADTLSEITLPEIKIMSGMSTAWIAQKIIYNSHPMSIRHFASNKSSKEVINYYASQWKLEAHGELSYDSIGDEMTIGYAYNGYAYSVQVKDVNYGSEGKLVVTRHRSVEQEAIGIPVHTDSKLVSRIQSVDLELEAETFTFSINMNSETNRQWYHASFVNQGWVLQENLSDNWQAQKTYQKGKQLCQLLFIGRSPIPNHHSMVIIHWIKG